jgi:AcrR family transcriptional regulator
MGKGELTRNRILDKAMCLASKEGLRGLTIGKLASVASLSKAGLFAHFGSKEALQLAVLEYTGARFRERVVAPVEAVPPGPQRLRALLRGCLDWIDDPAFPGGCPIMGACFELDAQEGPPREWLIAKQKAFQKRVAWMVREFSPPGTDVNQMVFEFRAITLAYQYSTRVLHDGAARKLARKALDAVLARAGQPRHTCSFAGGLIATHFLLPLFL